MKDKKELVFDGKKGGLSFSAVITVYLAITFLGQTILLLFLKQTDFAYICVNFLFSVIAVSLVSFFYVHKNSPKSTPLLKQKFNPLYLIPALFLAFGMFAGFGGVSNLFDELLVSAGLSVSAPPIVMDEAYQFVLLLIVACIFPAFEEELFFRGVLLDSLKTTKTIPAILSTSILFALFHMNASQLVYQFVYAIGLCYLTKCSKSPLPAIISHLINNAGLLIMEYVGFIPDLYNPYLIIGGVVSLLAFVGTTMLIYFVKNKKLTFESEESIKNKDKTNLKKFWLFASFGAFFSLLTIILGLFI